MVCSYSYVEIASVADMMCCTVLLLPFETGWLCATRSSATPHWFRGSRWTSAEANILARHWQNTNSSTFPGRVHVLVVLETSICWYINGHRKQYILVDIIFNYVFHFGRPGTNMSSLKSSKPTFLAPAEAAPNRWVLSDRNLHVFGLV